jgi:outer membrane protein OmpA-like peptidoglycan-associated protein
MLFMKKITSLMFFVAVCIFAADGQNPLKKIGDRLGQKVNQRANRKTDQAMDKTLDKAEKSIEKGAKGEGDDGSGTDSKSTTSKSTGTSAKQGLKSYSKYDFVPGDKIVYAEDFSQDVIGEFPLKWNTNGTGEVVTIEGLPGKWLQITGNTKYQSASKNKLPENFTVEFDLLVEFTPSRSIPYIEVQLLGDGGNQYYPPGVTLSLAPNGGIAVDGQEDMAFLISKDMKGQNHLEGKRQHYGTFNKANGKNMPVHISIWVQKNRYRAWINQDKIYDLPQAVLEGLQFTKLNFETTTGSAEFKYFISNIKMAVATPDTRSKLITEGKWSTSGILFDVNSDKIQATSYGVLKQIAGTLTENPDVKVKIIGHTDNDGDDTKNLDLSKRRAAAVKQALTSEFNIDADRMETDGMGETKPVADNKSPEAKAQNRRVEFVKL